jgi:hypothetical protein
MKSALWIVPDSIQSSIIQTPAGPILILSSAKPVLVTVHLVVTLDDVLATTNYTLAFSDGSDPTPGPGPKPDPEPTIKLPPLPSSLSILIPAFKQAAAEATSVEDLQTRTTNNVVALIGTNRYVTEFLPWRNKFTEVFNAMKVTDLKEAVKVWNAIK